MRNRTTKAHFKMFRGEVAYWLDKMSLRDWSVYCYHETIQHDALASCVVNWDSRRVDITLAKIWGNNLVTPRELSLCAFHEISEGILLAPISECALQMYSTEYMTQRQHAVVCRLEHALFDLDWRLRSGADEEN